MAPGGSPPAIPLTESAPAKVNLTLRVLGRRPDGYHELESLVVMAGVGDTVAMDPGRPLGLEVTGAEAGSLAGQANLIIEAAKAAMAAAPTLRIGHFRLEKCLPVASGIGGGSADAAAALRLIRRANPAEAGAVDWMRLAAAIGADVPVCLAGRPALMSGRGERIAPLAALPGAWLVLANPRIAVSTALVFRALAAPDLTGAPPPSPPRLARLDDLVAYLRPRANDLEAAAISLAPAIATVRDGLAGLDGALLARMSGSGATCFALFGSEAGARAGAAALATAHPDWWVRAAPVLD